MPASSSSSTSCHRFAWREPAALVWASSSTRTTSGWRASTASRSISSSPGCAADGPPRHDLEPVEELGGLRAAVRLDEPDHDVGAALLAAAGLAEHGVGLADARRHPEVDAQLAPPGHVRHGAPSRGAAESQEGDTPDVGLQQCHPAATGARAAATARFSSVTFTVGSPRKPRIRPDVACATRLRTCVLRQAGHPGHPRHLQRGVGRADVRVEAGARGRHRVRRARPRGPHPRGSAIAARRWLIVSASLASNVPLFEPPEVVVSAGPRMSFADAAGRVWK